MGIPVVKPGDKGDDEPFHLNVHQKVPLNMDRDNVTPAYLKLLRREVLNHAASFIPDDKINCTGVINGMAGAQPEVVNTVLDKLVGPRSLHSGHIGPGSGEPLKRKRRGADAGADVSQGRLGDDSTSRHAKPAGVIRHRPSRTAMTQTRRQTVAAGAGDRCDGAVQGVR